MSLLVPILTIAEHNNMYKFYILVIRMNMCSKHHADLVLNTQVLRHHPRAFFHVINNVIFDR